MLSFNLITPNAKIKEYKDSTMVFLVWAGGKKVGWRGGGEGEINVKGGGPLWAFITCEIIY